MEILINYNMQIVRNAFLFSTKYIFFCFDCELVSNAHITHAQCSVYEAMCVSLSVCAEAKFRPTKELLHLILLFAFSYHE